MWRGELGRGGWRGGGWGSLGRRRGDAGVGETYLGLEEFWFVGMDNGELGGGGGDGIGVFWRGKVDWLFFEIRIGMREVERVFKYLPGRLGLRREASWFVLRETIYLYGFHDAEIPNRSFGDKIYLGVL